MKAMPCLQFSKCVNVAPLVGAWIESPDGGQQVSKDTVAPLVGAWIERIVRMHLVCIEQSLLL